MAATLRGGDKLGAALQRVLERASTASGVSVGFDEDAAYPDGTPVALVAAVQEFGDPAHNIPPRPFFRTMVAQQSPAWGERFAEFLRESEGDASEALAAMGSLIAQQLRDSIQSVSGPPLAPETIRRKGNDTPLIDTGRMIDSITSEVQE